MGTATEPSVDAPPAGAKGTRARNKVPSLDLAQWQLKLLPFMTRMLVVLTIAFLLISLYETTMLKRQINAAPSVNVAPILTRLDCTAGDGTVRQRHDCAQWKVAVLLEQHLIERRYHQANVALLLRAWIKFIGFLTGMVLAITGAVFVLGRLSESMSEMTAEGAGMKVGLKSAYPGLILAGLGTALMIATVVVNPPTGVNDVPVYLSQRAP